MCDLTTLHALEKNLIVGIFEIFTREKLFTTLSVDPVLEQA